MDTLENRNRLQSIAILGGSFNPIHLGHLHLITEIHRNFSFDEIRLMPTAISPLKPQNYTNIEHRLKMIQLAVESISCCSGSPTCSIDLTEIQRGGISYTIETLKQLRRKLGEMISLTWIIGWDAFLSLEQWHQWRFLLKHSHLLVVSRNGHLTQNIESLVLREYELSHSTTNSQILFTTTRGKIYFHAFNSLQISSRKIREKLLLRKTVENELPATVFDFIREQKLYDKDLLKIK